MVFITIHSLRFKDEFCKTVLVHVIQSINPIINYLFKRSYNFNLKDINIYYLTCIFLILRQASMLMSYICLKKLCTIIKKNIEHFHKNTKIPFPFFLIQRQFKFPFYSNISTNLNLFYRPWNCAQSPCTKHFIFRYIRYGSETRMKSYDSKLFAEHPSEDVTISGQKSKANRRILWAKRFFWKRFILFSVQNGAEGQEFMRNVQKNWYLKNFV